MPRLGPFVAVTAILVTASPARAESREATERAARKARLSGDVTKGVELLSDLSLDTRDPTHIFNQARCFEQNNRCEEAIGRFREYLRKAPGLSPEVRADTEKHIADCQALLGQQPAPAPGSRACAGRDRVAGGQSQQAHPELSCAPQSHYARDRPGR
ncbi:MAG: hypothetical protein JXP73_20655 [Deltaproteobacteria bacterium]|nr:hypothetical protein [Deltaproteobacteria bacterium]